MPSNCSDASPRLVDGQPANRLPRVALGLVNECRKTTLDHQFKRVGAAERAARPTIFSMTSGNAAVLPEILRRIVDAYRPVRVYLFGSEARGEGGDDSDIDLAVVVGDSADQRQSAPRTAAEVLRGLERGADVVVFRESEFAARSGVVASLPWTIVREGRLIHGG